MITGTNCTGDAANCTPPCDEGYALQNDGVTCYGKSDQTFHLFFLYGDAVGNSCHPR